MPVALLTTASTIMCPHGGQAILQPGSPLFTVQQSPVLLESEIHSIAGCTFTIPPSKPQPCTSIHWSAGATQTKVNQVGVLLQTSVGICYSADQIPQGKAIVSQTQSEAQGA